MTMKSSRLIAITGSTGFAGSYLWKGLEQDGWRAKPLSRSGAQGTIGIGDLEETPDWDRHLEGVHTVIHCAAFAHRQLRGLSREALRQTIFRVNADAVAELADACHRNGVQRLLFFSSVKVYGECSGNRAWQEDDSLSPEDEYGASKKMAEELLRARASRQMTVCSLRLPLLYGPQPKANLRRLLALVNSGIPLPLAKIQNRRSLLGLNNLLRVVSSLLDKPEWDQPTINVADDEPISTPDLIRALADCAGKPARLFPLSPALMRGVATLMNRQDEIRRLTENLEVSTKRLRSCLPDLMLMPTGGAIRQMLATPAAESVHP